MHVNVWLIISQLNTPTGTTFNTTNIYTFTLNKMLFHFTLCGGAFTAI